MTRVSGSWLTKSSTGTVFDMLEQAGKRAFFVGGCVRDALAGRPVADIDISTDARPEETLTLAEKAGLKAIPTGAGHGTVTIVSDGIPYEVTTFRRDIETDGRRAVVAFSTRIEDDAGRRDFTMNALYADRGGSVQDPLGSGIADLAAGRVRFIGAAHDRIREDYLRILRFFRFQAHFGQPDAGFDAEDLAAVAANIDGLDTLPPERIGQEMRKLLAAPDPAPALATMGATGVLARLLPDAAPETLVHLVTLEEAAGLDPSWLRRLAAIGGDSPEDRLRLSRDETRGLSVRRSLSAGTTPVHEIGYRHGAEIAADVAALRAASMGTPLGSRELEDAKLGADAAFPVAATDLMPGLSGPALGRGLATLETRWIESRFTLTREDLLKS